MVLSPLVGRFLLLSISSQCYWNVRGQVQPRRRLPTLDGVALQLSSHEDLSPVGDRCI